jgi:hypothetical protein
VEGSGAPLPWADPCAGAPPPGVLDTGRKRARDGAGVVAEEEEGRGARRWRTGGRVEWSWRGRR